MHTCVLVYSPSPLLTFPSFYPFFSGSFPEVPSHSGRTAGHSWSGTLLWQGQWHRPGREKWLCQAVWLSPAAPSGLWVWIWGYRWSWGPDWQRRSYWHSRGWRDRNRQVSLPKNNVSGPYSRYIPRNEAQTGFRGQGRPAEISRWTFWVWEHRDVSIPSRSLVFQSLLAFQFQSQTWPQDVIIPQNLHNYQNVFLVSGPSNFPSVGVGD